MTPSSLFVPRHWWGKLIGGTLGLLKGGIGGAVIGLILGHLVDRFLAGIVSVSSTKKAFFESLFSTLGHLAKADGRVTETEIRMVESLMQRMQINGTDRQQAIRLFNQGKQADFDLDQALQAFVRFSVVRQDLRQMFMEILVEAAYSSGKVTPAENEVLLRVARQLHIPAGLFAAMMNARGSAWGGQGQSSGRRHYHGGYQRAAAGSEHSLDQDYARLGLKSSASDAEIKKAYRKLVSQYHPDKLVSRGLPDEMMEMAKKKVRDINTAYDRIKQARGFK